MSRQSYQETGPRVRAPQVDLVLGQDGDRLHAVLASALTQRGDQISTGLLQALCGFVRARRAEGLMAEHVVILVNRAMDQVGMKQLEANRSRLVANIVRVCIEEFYNTP